jgi:hypothetical protein
MVPKYVNMKDCLEGSYHENLYPKGFPEFSGAGRPPQYEKNDLIFPPSLWTSSMALIASERISIACSIHIRVDSYIDDQFPDLQEN